MKIKPTSVKVVRLKNKYYARWSVTAYHRFGRKTQYCRTREDARDLKQDFQKNGVDIVLNVEKMLLKLWDKLNK